MLKNRESVPQAVFDVAQWLQWIPSYVYQIGVGISCKEVQRITKTWPTCRLLGFEPNPESFRSLVDRYPGILCCCAIGSTAKKDTLYSVNRHKNASSFKTPVPGRRGQNDVVEYTVDVFPLNCVAPKPDGPALLWIDCEGSELDVLTGAGFMLSLFDMINIELTFNPPGNDWPDPADIHSVLLNSGFYLQSYDKPRLPYVQADYVYVKGKMFNQCYCSIPQSIIEFRNHLQSKDSVSCT